MEIDLSCEERIERKNFGPSWAREAWESRRATFGQLVPCRTRVTGVSLKY